MANKERQQTINKRNRERAVAEKRALKQQARQEKREAAKDGDGDLATDDRPDWLGPPNEQLGAETPLDAE
jgi:hypothetical protein